MLAKPLWTDLGIKRGISVRELISTSKDKKRQKKKKRKNRKKKERRRRRINNRNFSPNPPKRGKSHHHNLRYFGPELIQRLNDANFKLALI